MRRAAARTSASPQASRGSTTENSLDPTRMTVAEAGNAAFRSRATSIAGMAGLLPRRWILSTAVASFSSLSAARA